jgi:transposase
VPPPLALRVDELGAIVERTKAAALSAEDHAKLKAAMDTLVFVTAELQRKQTSLDRLRRLLFGATTETTRTLVAAGAAPGAPDPGASPSAAPGPAAAGSPRPGHGRTAADAYTGAEMVRIAHPTLHRADRCPGCTTGKIYPLTEPATLVRITGMAPLGATDQRQGQCRIRAQEVIDVT